MSNPPSQQKRAYERRQLLVVLALMKGLPRWFSPAVVTVTLPAHAQTSGEQPDEENPGDDDAGGDGMNPDAQCIPDTQAGGPLAGSASQADNCQAACEFTANEEQANLCSVTETETAEGLDCLCLLDSQQ